MTKRLRFWTSSGVGVGVLASFIIMLLSGVALPLHIAGAGTMVVTTGQMAASSFALQVGLDVDSASNDTAAAGECASTSQASAETSNVTADSITREPLDVRFRQGGHFVPITSNDAPCRP